MPLSVTLDTWLQASIVHLAGVTAKGPASANGPAPVPNAEAPFLSTVYLHPAHS